MLESETPKLSFRALSRSHSPIASALLGKNNCLRLPVSDNDTGMLTLHEPRDLRNTGLSFADLGRLESNIREVTNSHAKTRYSAPYYATLCRNLPRDGELLEGITLLGKQLAGANAFAANPDGCRHSVRISHGREKCGLGYFPGL